MNVESSDCAIKKYRHNKHMEVEFYVRSIRVYSTNDTIRIVMH